MEEQVNQTLSNIFEQTLAAPPASFDPADLPNEWDVGQHRYIRVLDGKEVLDTKLAEFREQGVRVLDFARRRGFWIFKVMAPRDDLAS